MSPALKFVVVATTFSLLPILWHFGTVLDVWGEAPSTRAEFFVRIGIIVACSIVGSIAASIVMAMATGEEDFEPDEREKVVLRKAELAGYYFLSAGVFVIIWFVFTPLTPMQIANALLAAFALSEIAKLIAGIFFLRRGV